MPLRAVDGLLACLEVPWTPTAPMERLVSGPHVAWSGRPSKQQISLATSRSRSTYEIATRDAAIHATADDGLDRRSGYGS